MTKTCTAPHCTKPAIVYGLCADHSLILARAEEKIVIADLASLTQNSEVDTVTFKKMPEWQPWAAPKPPEEIEVMGRLKENGAFVPTHWRRIP